MGLGSQGIGSIGLRARSVDAAASVRSRWRAFVGTSLGQVGSFTIAGVVGTLAASGQSFALAKLLGPEAFGGLVLLTATVDLVQSLVNPYAYEAMLRFTAEHDARRESSQAWAVLAIASTVDAVLVGVFLLGLWSAGDWISANLLGGQLGAGAILVYALCALERPMGNASRVVFAVSGRADIPQWFDCVTLVARCALAVAVLLLGYGILGVLWAGVISTLAIAAIEVVRAGEIAVRRWGRPTIGAVRVVLRRQGRQLFRFGATNNLNFLLSIPAKQLDSLAVGWTCGPQAAAFLKVAKGIASLVGLVVAPLQAVAYPRLVSARSRSEDALRDLVRRLSTKVALPVGALVVLAAPFVPWIVSTVLGPAYEGGAVPAALLFAGGALWLSTFWVRPLLLACDRVTFLTVTTAISSLVALASYVFVVPRWGVLGYAVVALGSQIVIQVGGALVARRTVLA